MTTPARRRMLVGGYTDDEPTSRAEPQGIVPILHDLSNGTLRQDGPALAVRSPSYLLAHSQHGLVYAVNEAERGAVSAVGMEGRLQVRAQLAISGQYPCHLCLSPDSGHLLVANYGSGNVVAVRLDAAGLPQEVTDVFDSYGTGPHARQQGPHAHHIGLGPDGTSWVVDLGADVVRRLSLSRDGAITEGEPVVVLPAGTGPRQIRLGRGRRTAYVLGELSGELITVELNPGREGTIVDRRPSWLTEPDGANLPAHLLVVGDLVYVSHRGLDRITVFTLAAGLPTPVLEIETGRGPRHFVVWRGWLYVADELGDQISARVLPPGADSPQPAVHCGVRRPTCVLPIR